MQEKNKRLFDIRGPNRYLSVHGHSGFSTYDGLGYPNEHMDFCIENGLDGWALTDHGHMNAFGHAQVYYEKLKKSGKNFRFIPGCEVYLHPSLDSWQVEYQAHKDKVEARKQEKRLAKELGEKNKRLVVATTDEDDETTGVGVIDAEDASFTIENEEETKSTSKYFNPLKRRHHLVVLPKNTEALPRLFHMVSRSYKEGFYGFPRIDYEMLREHSEGKHFVVSTACVGGMLAFEIFQEVQQLSFDELGPQLLDDASVLSRVMTRIGNVWDKLEWAVGRGNAFLELQFNKLGAQHLTNRALIEFAKQTGQTDRLIVTSDSHYPRPEQWKQRELYKKLGWLNYQEINPDSLPKSVEELKCELYPKNAQQVWEEFEKSASIHPFYLDHVESIRDAIERPHDIAHNLIGEIKPDRSMKLPNYVIPEGKTAVKALVDECKKGLIARGLADKPEYVERLKEELQVIKNKNFCEYFLTMKAILDTARERMLIGCGRGSGGGSLVNYVLNITDIDPIKYNLLFARFLSEFREGYPDIDCLASNHLVRLSNGSLKALGELEAGDEIVTHNKEIKKVYYALTRESKQNENIYQLLVKKNEILGTIIASEKHRFVLRNNDIKFVNELNVEDVLIDGTKISGIETYEHQALLTDIGVEGSLFEVIPFDVIKISKDNRDINICVNIYIDTDGDIENERFRI